MVNGGRASSKPSDNRARLRTVYYHLLFTIHQIKTPPLGSAVFRASRQDGERRGPRRERRRRCRSANTGGVGSASWRRPSASQAFAPSVVAGASVFLP